MAERRHPADSTDRETGKTQPPGAVPRFLAGETYSDDPYYYNLADIPVGSMRSEDAATAAGTED